MSAVADTTRAYLDLSRLSNLPTCFSNVLVGTAIGAAAAGAHPKWPAVITVAAGVALLYVAGMALNDLADADVDRQERPQRPIPSGRVSRAGAAAFTVTAGVVGLVLLGTQGPWPLGLGLALAACIVIYDLLHHRFAGAVLLMGACRGLVYLVAAAAVTWPLDASTAGTLAGILALYPIAITIIARAETGDSVDARRWLAPAMPLLVLGAALVVQPARWTWTVIAAVIMTAWLARAASFVLRTPPRTIAAVLSWLSGMCLVDAFFLTLLARPDLSLLALACFAATAWGHRRILGT